jgi:hypothetical protein
VHSQSSESGTLQKEQIIIKKKHKASLPRVEELSYLYYLQNLCSYWKLKGGVIDITDSTTTTTTTKPLIPNI